MSHDTASDSQHCLSDLSVRQVAARIRAGASLLVPLGGLEPVGLDAPLGLCAALAHALACRACLETGALVAPTMAVTCGMPFSAFAGSAGVRARTLQNSILDTIPAWLRQGFRRVVIVDCGWGNEPAIGQARARLDEPDRLAVFSLCAMLRERGGDAGSRAATLRDEQALLSMACHFGLGAPSQEGGTRPCDPGELAVWNRRGRDPARLARLAPDARLSQLRDGLVPDRGCELVSGACGRIVQLLKAGE